MQGGNSGIPPPQSKKKDNDRRYRQWVWQRSMMPKQQRRRGQVQKRNALFVTHVGLDNFEEDGRKTGWLLCAEYSSSGVPSNRLCISTMPADCQLRIDQR